MKDGISLHVGYNTYPVNTVVRWNVSQNGIQKARDGSLAQAFYRRLP